MGNQKIGKSELDSLLNQALLFSPDIKNNELIMGKMAKQIFSRSVFGGFNNPTITKVAMAALSIGTLVFWVYGMNSAPSEKQYSASNKHVDTITLVQKVNDAKLLDDSDQNLPLRNLSLKAINSKSKIPEAIVTPLIRKVEERASTDELGGQEMQSKVVQDTLENENIPILTEEEIKKNEKEKKNIIRIAAHVAKDRTRSVVKIPDSKNGKIKNLYFEGGEVTNREYRVFLFDLLIGGRKEDFLKAKPYQNRWINADGVTNFDFLEKEYFSNRKYDYYPVVNVSIEGAEMYCSWIQAEVDKLRMEDKKVNSIVVRLPYEFEWLYAAEAGREGALYPWPIDSVQNRSNCFMANFCAQKLKNEFRYPINYGKHQIDLTCYTTAGVFLRKRDVATIDVWSYNANAYGLYGMSGNVSELVYKNDSSGVKTKGGNWASDYKHLQLNSNDEFEGKYEPSPKIGFRVCVILNEHSTNKRDDH